MLQTILLAVISMAGLGFYFYDRFIGIYVHRNANVTSSDIFSKELNFGRSQSFHDEKKKITGRPSNSSSTSPNTGNLSSFSIEVK